MASLINSLPSELLCRVFSLAACGCYISHRNFQDRGTWSTTSPLSLTAVCKKWRSIGLNNPTLWTHIHVSVDTKEPELGYPSPQLWVERSLSLPLELYIEQYRVYDRSYSDEEDEHEERFFGYPMRPWTPMVQKLRRFVTPLMPRVSWLTLTINWPYESLINMLVHCWKTHGVVGRALALRVYNSLELGNPELESTASGSFFDSLTELTLRNATVCDNKNLIYGLTRLEIEIGEGYLEIDQAELAATLAACPKLQYLTLEKIRMTELPHSPPAPASLPDLKVLRVGMQPLSRTIPAILAVIDPKSNPLRLDLRVMFLREPNVMLAGLREFLGRSNVSTLYVKSRYTDGYFPPYFASQLGPLPRVRTLILERVYFYDELCVEKHWPDDMRDHNFTNPYPIDSPLPLWPQLESLYLLRCYLSKDYVCRLLSVHPVQRLFMRNCENNFQKESGGALDVGTRLGEQYAQAFSRVVPEVVHCRSGWGHWSQLPEQAQSCM